MSQDPGHSRVSWRPRSSGHAVGNMAGDRGVTLFVLLLSCWRHAEPQPINTISGPRTVLPPNLKNFDDNVAALFDEILVQEILDPSNSSLLMTQRPLPKSTTIMKKKKTYTQTDYKMDISKKHHKKKFSSGKEKRPFFDEEEKETLYQIKSLAVLEKIIDNLRRALGNTLKQRLQKHRRLFKGAKHHKGK
ncbi:sperm acrosome-associated protein 7-like [Panthera tigris]|uniref:sperm acrosome-associated protein 7-like n=1 Tax=Panthera tigris TaxID=9694 RepID=UPI001C6F9D30|nr:sperm acrosome-associated protein 7-like [Panthera tigris]